MHRCPVLYALVTLKCVVSVQYSGSNLGPQRSQALTELYINAYQYITIHINAYQYTPIHINAYQCISIQTNTCQCISIHINIHLHTVSFTFYFNTGLKVLQCPWTCDLLWEVGMQSWASRAWLVYFWMLPVLAAQGKGKHVVKNQKENNLTLTQWIKTCNHFPILP